MKNFRTIADEVMQDIHAGSELKEKTLQQLKQKKHIPTARILAAAACVLLTVGLVSLPGLFRAPVPDKNADMNILMSPADVTPVLQGQEMTMMAEGRKLEDLESARQAFGQGFMSPTMLPNGFRLESIYAYGEEQAAIQIILTYTQGENAFSVIEEKTENPQGFENAKKVDLRGEIGYLNPGASDGESMEPAFNELHWYANNVHYTISGLLSAGEAVETALSMK